VSEEQILDTAEKILSRLANKIVENGWSVLNVFG
jgi:hypothetical protein